ncbi:MAG: FmdB family transcriptional regulator [Firmicutes bacterium]|nr:FmdB family transcriptional regulator [Bacillota bacterium]
MPTYLYECENCGRFEEFQKITEEPLETCPKCDGAVKRIIGSPGIIFKGSGFYVTDNKSSDNSTTKTENNKEEKTENSGAKQEKVS